MHLYSRALQAPRPSPTMRGYAGIAQLVERVIRNDEVVGSIPISGTSKIKGLRWFRPRRPLLFLALGNNWVTVVLSSRSTRGYAFRPVKIACLDTAFPGIRG